MGQYICLFTRQYEYTTLNHQTQNHLHKGQIQSTRPRNPATARSIEGLMYVALLLQAKRLFLLGEPVTLQVTMEQLYCCAKLVIHNTTLGPSQKPKAKGTIYELYIPVQ